MAVAGCLRLIVATPGHPSCPRRRQSYGWVRRPRACVQPAVRGWAPRAGSWRKATAYSSKRPRDTCCGWVSGCPIAPAHLQKPVTRAGSWPMRARTCALVASRGSTAESGRTESLRGRRLPALPPPSVGLLALCGDGERARSRRCQAAAVLRSISTTPMGSGRPSDAGGPYEGRGDGAELPAGAPGRGAEADTGAGEGCGAASAAGPRGERVEARGEPWWGGRDESPRGECWGSRLRRGSHLRASGRPPGEAARGGRSSLAPSSWVR